MTDDPKAITSHYYIDPGMWDKSKITRAAHLAADRTGSSQLIHPHLKDQDCGTAVHWRVDPGNEELIELRRDW